MSGTQVDGLLGRQALAARGPQPQYPARRWPSRRRAARQVVLGGVLAVIVAVGGAAIAGYVTVNQLAGQVQRIGGIAALGAAGQPAVLAVSRGSMTVLLTTSAIGPSVTGRPGAGDSAAQPGMLIALVHFNADNRGGAVVSIPANTIVDTPDGSRMLLGSTLAAGGPSLLIRTVEHLTNVRIGHYSVLDFSAVRDVIEAMNGVSVRVPAAFTSEGLTFPAGTDRLTAASVLPYVRQPAVTDVGRAELQANLIRAMLDRIARKRLLANVGTDYRVLHALAAALSVDSSLSNAQLEVLGLSLARLSGAPGAFIT